MECRQELCVFNRNGCRYPFRGEVCFTPLALDHDPGLMVCSQFKLKGKQPKLSPQELQLKVKFTEAGKQHLKKILAEVSKAGNSAFCPCYDEFMEKESIIFTASLQTESHFYSDCATCMLLFPKCKPKYDVPGSRCPCYNYHKEYLVESLKRMLK